jgi:NADH dehydrogenase
MSFNVPKTDKKRVVIVGGGFGGLKLANKLCAKHEYQVVLIDRNNYHQFPPLIYQIASAGIEPSSISFPFRKIYRNFSGKIRKSRRSPSADAEVFPC